MKKMIECSLNIFAIDEHPIRSGSSNGGQARCQNDSEAGQMLSTSHRVRW